MTDDSVGDNLFYRNEFLQLFFLFPVTYITREMERNYLPYKVSQNNFEKYNFFFRHYFFLSKNNQQQLFKNSFFSKSLFKFTIKAFNRTTFLFPQQQNCLLFLHSTPSLKSFDRGRLIKKSPL